MRRGWSRRRMCSCSAAGRWRWPRTSGAAVVGRIATDDGALVAAAEELVRVLSAAGRVSFAEPDSEAGEQLARALTAAGFEAVGVGRVGEEVIVSGRLG